jgi:TRAP-type C4-dicarboxylate transport system substrate-binding protein
LEEKMKKLIGVSLVIMLVFALAGCGKKESDASRAASGAPVKWRMSTIYVDPGEGGDITYKSLGAAMRKFISDVNTKSNGRLEITGFYASVLGSANDTFQQMERGELEVYYGQPMSAIDTRFGAWSIPYLFRNYDEIRDIACNPDGDFFKMSASWISEHNAILLAMGITNTRGLFNAKHRVVKVADVKDLKLRTYEDPVVNAFWESICQAIPMPVSEVYTALQTKSVDGLEFAPTSIISRRYNEVGKFYSDINWQWAAGATFVVNADAFKKLPADLQKIVTDCAREAAVYQGQREIADEKTCFETLAKDGVEIYYMTPAERQDWIDYANSISDKIRRAVGAETYDKAVSQVEAARTKK